MGFARTLEDTLKRDETVRSRMQSCKATGSDVWRIGLRVDWKAVGMLDLRTASHADAAALRRFLTHELSARSIFLFAPYPMDDTLDESIDTVLRDTSERRKLTYNAWLGDRVVAHCFLWSFSDPVPTLGLAVADAFHGKKIGHLCMNVLIAAARHAGKKAIYLTTNVANHAGFHLYGKLGFKYTGDKQVTLGDGSSRIEREMTLPL